MTEDSVVALHHPGVTADPLTAVPLLSLHLRVAPARSRE